MTVTTTDEARYDPYDIDLNSDPYPMFRLPAKRRRCTTTPSMTSTR